MSEELKLCRCGGEAQMRGSSDGEVDWYQCRRCGYESSPHYSRTKAIEAWNTRISPDTDKLRTNFCAQCKEYADELDRLRAENERLAKAWEAQHAEKVKEKAEAKLWFEKAQEWKDALERIATVDMGGGFLGAQACRKFARAALEAKP